MANPESSKLRNKFKSLLSTRWGKWLLRIVPIAIVTPFLAGPATNLFREKWQSSRYKAAASLYVAVVASKASVDFTIPAEFVRGFENGSQGNDSFPTWDRTPVAIKQFEDLGSPTEASRLAYQLLNDPNCILVIGNSDSTLTAVTLDIFLAHPNPPSYILPIATANDLITKANGGKHHGVLRMVPDNSNQAEVIGRLATSLSLQRRIAIYSDQDNTTYSIPLSVEIASGVRKSGSLVVIEEGIGPSNSIYASISKLQGATPPDLIVYVGVAHHGLLLIDQLAELKITIPIVFTDGCMVAALKENIPRIPNRAFVLSPVGDPQPSKMPTYEAIGKDASTLAAKILSKCSNCSRATLRDLIATSKDQFAISNGNAGEYKFNAEGNNMAMKFKVYEITGGHLAAFNVP